MYYIADPLLYRILEYSLPLRQLHGFVLFLRFVDIWEANKTIISGEHMLVAVSDDLYNGESKESFVTKESVDFSILKEIGGSLSV